MAAQLVRIATAAAPQAIKATGGLINTHLANRHAHRQLKLQIGGQAALAGLAVVARMVEVAPAIYESRQQTERARVQCSVQLAEIAAADRRDQRGHEYRMRINEFQAGVAAQHSAGCLHLAHVMLGDGTDAAGRLDALRALEMSQAATCAYLAGSAS